MDPWKLTGLALLGLYAAYVVALMVSFWRRYR